MHTYITPVLKRITVSRSPAWHAPAPPSLASLPQRQSRSCLLLGGMCISQNFQLIGSFLKLAGLPLQSSSAGFLGSLVSCCSGMHVEMRVHIRWLIRAEAAGALELHCRRY